jgi:hypothetical protein
MVVNRTLRLKVKAEAYGWLGAAAREVNREWNRVGEISREINGRYDVTPDRNELCGYRAGATENYKYIGADTIQRVCYEYAGKIRQRLDIEFEALKSGNLKAEDRAAILGRIHRLKNGELHWRSSGGPKHSLGWVPFKAASLKWKGKSFRFAGKHFRTAQKERFLSEDGDLTVKWGDSCFAQDAVGDWYLCLSIKVPVEETVARHEEAGIDLGLTTTAAASDGWKAPNPHFAGAAARKLAALQRPRGTKKTTKRTRNAKKIKRLQRKVARQRKDHLHKVSRKLVNRYQRIAIGDLSISRLAMTFFAKSVYDAALGMLVLFVVYKAQAGNRTVCIVDEKFTTRACHKCGALNGPKGLDRLVEREWRCTACDTVHDRDTNAARNILSRAQVSGWTRPGDPEREKGVRLRERGVSSGAAPAEPAITGCARHGEEPRSGAP